MLVEHDPRLPTENFLNYVLLFRVHFFIQAWHEQQTKLIKRKQVSTQKRNIQSFGNKRINTNNEQ